MRAVSLAACALALASMTARPASADDKASAILAAARAALGGPAVEGVRSLSAKGEYRRVLGEREIEGEMTVELLAPDRLKRTEEMGIPGGPTISRVVALNGGEFWEDTKNRGDGGFARFGRGQRPDGAGRPSEADRERFRQLQQRRLEGDLRRYMLSWLARTDAPTTYIGEAEADDGRADVIEVKPDGAAAMRLFVDQRTHLPLMLTYEGVMPRFVSRRGPARPDADPAGRREPPQQVTFELRYQDYKSVDGVMLPHTITQSVNGNPSEEWTVTEYKVNPDLDPESFSKK